MRAAVLYGPMDLRIEEIPLPEIGADDVLIKVKVCGICGSDYHYWKHGRAGAFVINRPLVLGHEFSGIVEEVGESVTTLERGDRVVVEPGVPCRKCGYCRSGRYNLCPHMRFMGSAQAMVNGAFAEYVASPYDFVYKMPAGMTFEEGAMIEPLSVALWAVSRSGVSPASSAVVFGVGPIGSLVLEVMRAVGVTRIYAVDVDDWRLDFATRLGALATFNPEREEVVRGIMEVTGGEGVDVVVEASGAEMASRQAVEVVKRGGVLVLVGMYAQRMFPYPLLDIVVKELDVRGVFRYANMFPVGIELVSKGMVNVRQLVTHTFPFEEIERAFRLIDERRENFMKVQVRIN